MTTAPTTPLLDAQKLTPGVKEIIESVYAMNGSGTKNPKSGTDISTSRTKLSKNTALAMMNLAAEDAGYNVKFSLADVEQFIKEFDAKQNEQVQKVITSTSQKLTPGATAGAVDKEISSTAKTEYPSLFKPSEFAMDWVWKRVDFKNEAQLGAKALSALGQVRGLVDEFQLMGVSNKDILAAAKAVAMGSKTIDSYKVELQQIAKKEYPQFAERFTLDPTLTTYDIASPIIGMLAKTWEVDVKDVKMDDPIVMSYMNYAGADGKGKQPSRYDLLLQAKNSPKYKFTQQANEEARDAAVGLASAFGFGV